MMSDKLNEFQKCLDIIINSEKMSLTGSVIFSGVGIVSIGFAFLLMKNSLTLKESEKMLEEKENGYE